MLPIDIPPGVMQAKAKAPKSNSWRETNLIRWDDGTLYPIGGWEPLQYDIPFASRVRKIHRWLSNDGTPYIAYLCEQHVYVDIAGVLTDISPTVPLVSPVSAGFDQGGYGEGPYSADEYGTPRDVVPRLRVYTPSYSIGNWGEDLRVMTSADGRYLGWSPTTPGDPCDTVPTSPTGRGFVITPEQHVIIYGVDGDFNHWGWCSRSDDQDWDFGDPTNTAGDYFVQPASHIIAMIGVGSQILGFTANGFAHVVNYLGSPYIYSEMVRMDQAGIPYSADCVTTTPDGAIWVSNSGYWSFNGVNVAPLKCEIWDWVTDLIDASYTRYEGTIINVAAQSEAWFFFVETGERYNSRVAIYDYRQKIWSMGSHISRSAGFSSSNDDYPLMSNGETVFKHEAGLVYADYAHFPYAETFTINTNAGTNKITVMQLFAEIDGDYSALRVRAVKSNKRIAGGGETFSNYKSIRDNGYIDVRETARDIRLRFEAVSVPSECWSIGEVLIDAVQRGHK